MVRDMTSGSPIKHIISFCLPMLIGNLCQQLYNMVDTMVVGQGLGKDALAAVGSTGSLDFLVIGFIIGVCSGFTIPVSQYFGAKDYRNMRKSIANGVYLAVLIAAAVTALTMLLTGPTLKLMKTPDNIFDMAYSYIIILFAGTAATMFYNILSSILRAVGDSRTPLYFLIISSIINVILDVLFVIVFNFGVAGAAYATVASQIISGVGCLIYIIKKYTFLIPRRDELPFDSAIAKHSLYMGLPMGLQFSITALGTIVLQSAVNGLGSDTIAAVTTAQRIQSLVLQPMETLGITMATYCGQNLGASKIDRISKGFKQALIVMVAYCIFSGIIISLLGDKIAYLFIKKEEVQILSSVQYYLRINGFSYVFLGFVYLFRNSIQGLGYSMIAMAAGLFELIARSAIALFLVGSVGFAAVCFASPAAWVAADLLLIPVYLVKVHNLKVQYANRRDIDTMDETQNEK